MAQVDVESTFDSYLERFRALLEPQTWQRLFMDLSKNDALALLRLHRVSETRMSDLADYLGVPLNTATGVVTRLARRGLVDRQHSADDKRVVVVALSARGRTAVAGAVREVISVAQRVLEDLSEEQVGLLLGVVDKVLEVLTDDARPDVPRRATRRIAID